MAKADTWVRKKPSKRNRLIILFVFIIFVLCLVSANPSVQVLFDLILNNRFQVNSLTMPKQEEPSGSPTLLLPREHILTIWNPGKSSETERRQWVTSVVSSLNSKSGIGGSDTEPAPNSSLSSGEDNSSQVGIPASSASESIKPNAQSIGKDNRNGSLAKLPSASNSSSQNKLLKKRAKFEALEDSRGTETAEESDEISSSGGTMEADEMELDTTQIPEKTMFSAPLSCQGKYIFTYDLPKQYNQGFLDNCATIHRSVNMCEAFSHGGAGWPANRKTPNSSFELLPPKDTWYETDQFGLEIIFHARMKHYPCLTTNPYEATLFYIPFFPGLAIFRSVYEKNLTERDRVHTEVLGYLRQFPWWDRHKGMDHFLVITRVLIDFTRDVVRPDWGSNLMKQPNMRTCNILGIESHPKWANLKNVHSVPYPTSFHPSTDKQIRQWQKFIRDFRREYLVAFAGVGHGFGANLRQLLYTECGSHPDGVCRFFDCRNRVCIMRPQNVIWFYMGARFCLQPPGDTPTRKGMFDCMLAGAIPVVFHDETASLYKWHLPADQDEVIIYIPKKSSSTDVSEVIPLLKGISAAQIQRMHERIVSLIPHLAYAYPGNSLAENRDAFTIAIESLLKKVSRKNLPFHPKLDDDYLS